MTDESSDLTSDARQPDEGQLSQSEPLDESERAVGELLQIMLQLESLPNDLSQENPQLSGLAQNLLNIVAEHRRQAGQPEGQLEALLGTLPQAQLGAQLEAQPQAPREWSPFDWDDEEGA